MTKKLLLIAVLIFAVTTGIFSTSIANDPDTIQARDKAEIT